MYSRSYFHKKGSLVIFFFALFIFSSSFSHLSAQNDNNPLIPGEKNFYEIQQAFNEAWNSQENKEDLKGWKQYKRWEWFMEPRVYPSGVLPNPMATFNALNPAQPMRPNYKRSSGNWKSIGPAISSGTGIGRANCVVFHPSDTNIIWIGAPAGGLWKSIDGGVTWTTNTDNLPAIGVSDLVINPQNPSIMYLASSDGDAYDTYSLGVLKSTDGGTTWQVTSLNWNVQNVRTIRRLIMHPDNPDILYAATSAGIYKTTNGGTSWVRKATNGFNDIQFKPGNPRIVYAAAFSSSGASNGKFYRSTDNGETFTEVTADFSGYSNRIAIGVTSADTNYVYILASESPTSNYSNRHGFYGFYRSTDGGASFTEMSTSPNILGWATNGNDLRGQGWYDLSIAVSPVHKNLVFCGGVNIWKTTNGGTSWTLNAHWYGGGGAPWVHADIHDMRFHPLSPYSLYVGSDGGIFRSLNNGSSYSDISQSLVISQVYKIGISATDPKLLLAGLQDNGTKLYDPVWENVVGGDGMECLIDYSNNNYMYGSLYYGDIRRSSNGGANFTGIKRNITESGGWVTPYIINPKDPKMLYGGYGNIWRNNNRGYDDWYKVTNWGSSSKVVAMAISEKDTSVMYAAKSSTLYRTTNSGATWEIKTPTSSAYITYIAVHPEYPNIVYVTFSGYSASNKVYVSDNYGDSWTNISGNLPNLPVNCIVTEKGSNAGVYVGTDVGVYFRDSMLTDWIPYLEGLPNVIVNELEIYYDAVPSKSKIVAATYGRGIWESELYYSPTTPPSADFWTASTTICKGYTVTFDNISVYSSTYKWYFPGGNPSTSTERSPRIQYETAGTYNVILVASNDYGSDSIYKAAYLTVDPAMECVYVMNPLLSGDIFSTCLGRLYDPGEKNNYTSNLNTYITIAPPGASGVVLEFISFDTEKDYDILDVYDGPDLSSTRIGSYSGNALPNKGIIVSSDSAITLRFRTDALDNRAGFELTWRCIRPDEAPFAYFIIDNPVSCTGKVTFEDHSLNNPDSWTWYFGDGNTSTDQNPVHKYKETGLYDVKLIISSANGSDSFDYKGIYVELPDPPVVESAARCGEGSLTLGAQGDGTLLWLQNESDATPIKTGFSFTTPVLSSTTSYFVKLLTAGNSNYGGPYSNSIGSGGYYNGFQGLIFDANRDIELVSVKIYASGDIPRTFTLKDKYGNTLYDSTFSNIKNGENRVSLNFRIPKDSNYVITSNAAQLYRNNSGASYPYLVSDLATITASTAGYSYYYFFYDWEVREVDVCESKTVEVIARIDQNAPAADFSYSDSGLYLTFSDQTTDAFTYTWYFGDGNSSTEAEPMHRYDDGGTYDVKLVVKNGCGADSVSKTINVTNSIVENGQEARIAIYPNPNSGNFLLDYSGPSLQRINIIDVSGHVIYSSRIEKEFSSRQLPIELTEASGVYFIQLITKENTIVRKFFIRK
ncbi:PKD domain-containing protein [Bacteroidota bacterium]